jgi:hypothetical protein
MSKVYTVAQLQEMSDSELLMMHLENLKLWALRRAVQLQDESDDHMRFAKRVDRLQAKA